MNQPLPIESVKNSFVFWRASRQMVGPTPVSLQKQAVALKKTYPVGQIVIELGINSSTLKRWSVEYEDAKNVEFISLASSEPEINRAHSVPVATCEFPNGVRLLLSDKVFNSHLLSTISQLNMDA